ncbi:MAG: NUDIX hydrolase [Thermoanaerobaculia bacterium]|nr:NUDIX hydrolase [Thermoanaerobaculia bacterium]
MPPSAASLLDQLRSYPGMPGEKDVLERFLSLLERPADPFSRENHDHVTASTVIAHPGGHEVLLRYHRKLERWLQPGGHVEPEDASVFDAALREAREETGIEEFGAPLGDRILDLDIHDIPGGILQPPHRHYDVRYLLIAPPDASASEKYRTRWVPLETLTGEDTDASLGRAIGKARQWREQAAKATPQVS